MRRIRRFVDVVEGRAVPAALGREGSRSRAPIEAMTSAAGDGGTARLGRAGRVLDSDPGRGLRRGTGAVDGIS